MKDIKFFKALLLEEMDEKKLSKKQMDIADEAPPKDKITGADFAALRKKKGMNEMDADQIRPDLKAAYDQGYEAGYAKCKYDMTGEFPDIFESEVSEDIQSQKMTEADRFTKIMRNIMWDKDWSPKDYANQIKGLSDETLKSWYELSKKNKGIPNSPLAFQQKLVSIEMQKRGLNESEDHEVSMAHNSLKSIVSSASQLMNLLGNDEKDIPAWIQDHITNAENFINQASKNYHDYNEGSTGEYDMDELPDGTEEVPAGDAEDLGMSLQSMMEDLLEAKKKKPSAGLTKKQKSNIVKKAKAGKDMGKKGKGFEKIVKAAEKSGARDPQAVAGAAFWKGQAKKAK